MADLVFTAAFDADAMMSQAAKMEAASASWEAKRLAAAKANEAAIAKTRTDAIDLAVNAGIAQNRRDAAIATAQQAILRGPNQRSQEDIWAANTAREAQRLQGIEKSNIGLISLNRTAALTQLIFARLIFPALAAERIVRATVYINDMKIAAINAGQELQKMGEAFTKATNERIRSSRAQEADALPGATGGKSEAEQIEQRRRADQEALQEKHIAKMNELEQESLGKKALRFFTGTTSADEEKANEEEAFQTAKAQREKAAASEQAELKARTARENVEKARKQQLRSQELARISEDAQANIASQGAEALGNRNQGYQSQVAKDLADYNAQIIAIGRIVDLTEKQRNALKDSAFDVYRSKGAALDRRRAMEERNSALNLEATKADARSAAANAVRKQADMMQSLGGSSAAGAARRIDAAKMEAEAQAASHRVDLARKMEEIKNAGDIGEIDKRNRQDAARLAFDEAMKATNIAMLGSIVDEVAKGRDLRGLVGKSGAGESRYASQQIYGGDYNSKMYSGQQTLIKAVQQLPDLIRQIADNTSKPNEAVFSP